jgi:hypothetical protein
LHNVASVSLCFLQDDYLCFKCSTRSRDNNEPYLPSKTCSDIDSCYIFHPILSKADIWDKNPLLKMYKTFYSVL